MAAFILAVAATLVVLFAPLVTVVSRQITAPGQADPSPAEMSRISIVESEGWEVLWAVAIPLALAAMPLAFAASRFAPPALVLSAALLSAFCLLASFSIGWAYVPAAVAMWIAAAVEGRLAKSPQGRRHKT